MNNHRNGGFTLVELMVTIAVGSLITLAATTILLLGLRVNAQSTGTVTRQNTARILLSVLEDMATEGAIKEVEVDEESGAWKILGERDGVAAVLFSYDSVEKTVCTGENTTLMEEVLASSVEMSESSILTFSVETEDGRYSSSIYCRMTDRDTTGDTVVENLREEDAADNVEGIIDHPEARKAFLDILATQYKLTGGLANHGTILDNSGKNQGIYYSQWYVGSVTDPDWDEETPWCACFVSWGLSQVSGYVESPSDRIRTIKLESGEEITYYYWYADVNSFVNYFEQLGENHWKDSKANTQSESDVYTPQPGDLIFFDWEVSGDPDHVGAVLTVADGCVYTIEGNSANMVAIRKYELSDSRIMGYGVLNWK